MRSSKGIGLRRKSEPELAVVSYTVPETELEPEPDNADSLELRTCIDPTAVSAQPLLLLPLLLLLLLLLLFPPARRARTRRATEARWKRKRAEGEVLVVGELGAARVARVEQDQRERVLRSLLVSVASASASVSSSSSTSSSSRSRNVAANAVADVAGAGAASEGDRAAA